MINLNYYAIFDALTDELIAEGNARECKEKLGYSSIDTFYALVSRSNRGLNKSYKVVVKKEEKQIILYSENKSELRMI